MHKHRNIWYQLITFCYSFCHTITSVVVLPFLSPCSSHVTTCHEPKFPFLTAVKVWFHSRHKLVFSSLSFNPHLVSFCAACSTLLVHTHTKKNTAVLCLVLGKKKKNNINKKDPKKFHLTLKETSLLKMHFLQWAKEITISEVYNRKRKNEQERERKGFKKKTWVL